ncbi:SUMF1/EgtB/PvdO family nonheme iron enzyme [Acaryochloris sp. IP29b_bin.148]|uniref:SUMF1/EgtB/PvdO family nonheme iron enzyme n=1 Tax=Acaryochloris sp. IP29b_bin.148 TaxID=2969218 RepID=UPI0026312804|nr:SUMF1/EgtB/PvdO family nonheme iron enzyme [Acaryochloris sp. IP29b_bin.148]
MPSNWTPTTSAPDSLQATLQQHFTQTRARTLRLFADVNADVFRLQANPDFSPVGWHLGHIGFTEGLWLLEQAAGHPPLFPEYRRLFAADGLPKAERQHLPSFTEICEYLHHIRAQIWDYLSVAPLASQAWLWYWLAQHESQHCETISWVLQLHRQQTQTPSTLSLASKPADWPLPSQIESAPRQDAAPQLQNMVYVEGGEFFCGHEGLNALDNEKAAHWVNVDPFWIDRFPVTQADYQQFIDAGGYRQSRYWSEEGWRWLQANPVSRPAHWLESHGDAYPVCGVSWYEAEAYARFMGKRLPTEREWEKAASWQSDPPEGGAGKAMGKAWKRVYPWGQDAPTSEHCNYGTLQGGTTPVDAFPQGQSAYGCYDMLGNVWEWTQTWFHPYPNFQPYPYKGYSLAYFDQAHRVLKGGSWATQVPVLRCAFRNWYEPRIRIHFAGFRCAYS